MTLKNTGASGVLELQGINMRFPSGEGFIDVLSNVSFEIGRGESAALVGQSGAGKSTLLQIAALLEKPTSGDVLINGRSVLGLSDNEKTAVRRNNIGFVYQYHNLLPEFSALENVMIPQLMRGVAKNEALEKAKELLDAVGLSHRLDHGPKKLSGGEQQRAAIARALANDPDIIIADEPTGNLDNTTANVVFELLLNLINTKKMSILMATHNLELAKMLDKKIVLANKVLDIK